MSRKRAVALSGDVVVVEMLDITPIESLDDTLEEYKNLSEKCDQVIVKIKTRKARKKK